MFDEVLLSVLNEFILALFMPENIPWFSLRSFLLKGAAIRAKFNTKRRYTLKNPRRDHICETFVELCIACTAFHVLEVTCKHPRLTT